jgi:pyrrolidone-carboxylate peptidase
MPSKHPLANLSIAFAFIMLPFATAAGQAPGAAARDTTVQVPPKVDTLKQIILLSFEPFENDTANISDDVRKRIAAKGRDTIGKYEIFSYVLPAEDPKALNAKWNEIINEHPNPYCFIGTGAQMTTLNELPKSNHITIETGNNPVERDGMVVDTALLRKRYVNKPLNDIFYKGLTKSNRLDVGRSDNAGSHACNHLLALILQYCEKNKSQGTFLHFTDLQPSQFGDDENSPLKRKAWRDVLIEKLVEELKGFFAKESLPPPPGHHR